MCVMRTMFDADTCACVFLFFFKGACVSAIFASVAPSGS